MRKIKLYHLFNNANVHHMNSCISGKMFEIVCEQSANEIILLKNYAYHGRNEVPHLLNDFEYNCTVQFGLNFDRNVYIYFTS